MCNCGRNLNDTIWTPLDMFGIAICLLAVEYAGCCLIQYIFHILGG